MKRDDSVIQKINRVVDGFFLIDKSLIEITKNTDLFLSGLGISEQYYLTTINKESADTITIELPIKYKKRFGYAICPKCHKADKVCTLVYSDPPFLVMKIQNGDTTYSPILKRKYSMMTDVTSSLDPRWYCIRDNLFY